MAWRDITVSLVSVYLGFYIFIVFLSLSIACGLYYLAELIEEYTITSKKLLGHVIRLQLLLHLLLFVDRLPVLCIVVGLAAHVAYLRCMRRFPYIALATKEGSAAVGLFVVSNVLWLRHFYPTHFTAEYIGAFMLITTWVVPFLLFLSLAGDQAVLPGAYGSTGYAYSGSGSGLDRVPSGIDARSAATSAGGGTKKRRSALLRLFDVMRRKRDAVLPGVLDRLPDSHLRLKEKL